MSQVAVATFLRFFTGNTDVFKWQNFFVNKEVDGFAYEPFTTGTIIFNRSMSEGGLAIEMPMTAQNLTYMEASINEGFLIEILLYELPVVDGPPTSLDGAKQVSKFLGEVIEIQTDLTVLSAELGTGIDAVAGDVPGRKITTNLVGRMPRI